jgi:Flp pilus assembly protein TadD
LAAAASLLALSGALLLTACDSVQSPKATATDAQQLMNTQLQAARQAEASYNYSDAVSIYQTLYSQHQGDMDLGMSLARNLRFAGQPGAEIALVGQLMTKGGRSAPLLLELGKAYLAADQDNLALPTLLEAKSKEPNNWEVLSTLGVAYDYQGSYADARDAYAQALVASPSNATVLNNLALSQASSGDLDGAIATLQQAIDQPSATAQTRQNLALLLALKGDPTGAERLARKDLPPEIADGNIAYFRMLSAAAAKGGAPAPASAIMPAATAATSSIDPAPFTAAPDEPAAATWTPAPAVPEAAAPVPATAATMVVPVVPAPTSTAEPASSATPLVPILPVPSTAPLPENPPAAAPQSVAPKSTAPSSTSSPDSEAVR